MTDPFDFAPRLESRLRDHAASAVRPADAAVIASRAIAQAPRPASLRAMAASWGGRGSQGMTARLALIGLLLAATAAAGAVLIGAALQRTSPMPAPAVIVSPTPTSATLSVAPIDLAIRAKWVANASPLPSLQNGGGPVSLTIDSAGSRLSVDNFAPGAAFASAAEQIGPDRVRLLLDGDSGGCAMGDEGIYGWSQASDGLLLTLTKISDSCQSRSEALGRTWARSLVGSSFRGAGVVDMMAPTFAVSLRDDSYEARTLDDFIEIGGSGGFSLMVFKNPQGFVDACSDQEVRYPYTPGAAAFVEYYRQNDAFTVVEATSLKIDGHDAIHLVTKVNSGGRCPSAPLYALTPKDCNCHFLGGDDSLYLVDVGPDTFLFQLSPTTGTTFEAPLIETIRIPYELPTQ
jgi:hypothetical protein